MRRFMSAVINQSRNGAFHLITVLILLAGSNLIFGQEREPDPSIPAFDTFQTIIDRNIFNPRRRPVEIATFSISTPTPEKTIRTEHLYLTGSLIHDGTGVVFFEGSQDEFEGAFSLHETIAGFRIAQILTDGVQLEQNGNRILLSVGSGLSRPEGGEWKNDSGFSWNRDVQQEASVAPVVTSATPSEGGVAADNTGSPSAGGLLERLMERRRQELGQ